MPKETTVWIPPNGQGDVSTSVGDSVLLETGDSLLLENGDDLLLEDTTITPKDVTTWEDS